MISFLYLLVKGFFFESCIPVLGGIAIESTNGAVRLSRGLLTKPMNTLDKNVTNVNGTVEVDHCFCKVKKNGDKWATNRITVQWKSNV